MQTPAPKNTYNGESFEEAMKSVEGRKAIEIAGLKYIKSVLRKESLLTKPMPWCKSTWTEGNPGYVNVDLCYTCKNHLLRLGGGRCWELDYEEK